MVGPLKKMRVMANSAPAQIEVAGHLLFGELWVRPLSRMLGVTERRVRRWRDGVAPIPAGVKNEILRELYQRIDNIQLFIDTCTFDKR